MIPLVFCLIGDRGRGDASPNRENIRVHTGTYEHVHTGDHALQLFGLVDIVQQVKPCISMFCEQLCGRTAIVGVFSGARHLRKDVDRIAIRDCGVDHPADTSPVAVPRVCSGRSSGKLHRVTVRPSRFSPAKGTLPRQVRSKGSRKALSEATCRTLSGTPKLPERSISQMFTGDEGVRLADDPTNEIPYQLLDKSETDWARIRYWSPPARQNA